MAQEVAQEKEKKGSLFGDLSVAQLIAGALAAATSMLLASQIGIAGSVIGVAVGSIVSAVASQLYKRFLTASAEKIRVLQPGATAPNQAEAGQVDLTQVLPLQEEELDVPGKFDTRASAKNLLDAGATTVLHPLTVRCSKTPRVDDEALQNDITVQRARALRERKTKIKRRVLAVSVVSGFAAVLVSASVIGFLTTGEGLGAKTSWLADSLPQSHAPVQYKENDGSASSSGAGQESSTGESSGDQSASTSKPGDSTGTEGGGQQGSSGSQDSTTGGSSGSDAPTDGTVGDAGNTGGSDSTDGSGSPGDSGDDGQAGDSNSGGDAGAGGDSSADGSTGGALPPSTNIKALS